jgi:hypothetical protein
VPLRLSCGLRRKSSPATSDSASAGCKVAATRPPVVVRRTLLAMPPAIMPVAGGVRSVKLSITWSASLR